MIFSCFTQKLKEKVGGLLGGGGGGGGGKEYVGPPLSNYWGGAWPPLAPPLPTPMQIHVIVILCSNLTKLISTNHVCHILRRFIPASLEIANFSTKHFILSDPSLMTVV